ALAKPTRASVQFQFQSSFQFQFQFQCPHASTVCPLSSLVRPALPLRTPSSSHTLFGHLNALATMIYQTHCASVRGSVGATMDEAAMQHADSMQQMFASLAARCASSNLHCGKRRRIRRR
ncbi:Hypothetical protein PHPALM_8351, partial [Phytophthora palmivora]